MADEAVLKPKRPLLVWGIVIFMLYGAVGGILTEYLMTTGTIPLYPEVQAQMDAVQASQTIVDRVTVWLFTALGIVAVIALFLMKRLAFPIFVALTILGWCNYIRLSFTDQFASFSFFEIIMSVGLGEIISLLILFYVWHLYKEGVLR